MAISFGSNIDAIRVQRLLYENAQGVSAGFERLSSGMRINHPSDDPAGLAVSAGLNVASRVYTTGIRNINDGISLLSTADSTLQQLSSVSIRIRELATQAANGSFSLSQRQSLNSEANTLVAEFNRTIQSTRFNGLRILDGSQTSSINIQGGIGSDGTLSLGLNQGLSRNVGNMTYSGPTSVTSVGSSAGEVTGDFNLDGNIDLIAINTSSATLNVLLGRGDGTFNTVVSYTSSITGLTGLTKGDFNSDGRLDIAVCGSNGVGVFTNQGSGTFGAARTYSMPNAQAPEGVACGDMNGDGFLDLVSADNTSGGFINVFIGNGNGSFNAYRSYSPGLGGKPQGVILADFNGDGKLDAVTGSSILTFGVMFGNGDGSLSGISNAFSVANSPGRFSASDFNGDGRNDLVFSYGSVFGVLLGTGSGNFSTPVTFSAAATINNTAVDDVNGDGIPDILLSTSSITGGVNIYLGNGDGTFQSVRTYGTSAANKLATGDFNGDGVPDIAAGTSVASEQIFIANTSKATTIGLLNINTREGALSAIGTIDAIIGRIQLEFGFLGGHEKRLGVALDHLTSLRDNYVTASARITDSDTAQEASRLVRGQVLTQVGSSLLAQASINPQIALSLLKAA